MGSESGSGKGLERVPTFVNLAHVQSAGSQASAPRRRRSSALEAQNDNGVARQRTRTLTLARNDLNEEELLSLTRSVSRISGHKQSYLNASHYPSRPQAAWPGPVNTIREVPSEFVTPLSSRPPSPTLIATISRPPSPSLQPLDRASLLPFEEDVESDLDDDAVDKEDRSDVGTINSWRGAAILLVTCGAQLMDNVFMTGVNIALPAIQKEFTVPASDLQWLISAYTLTFGGFLLLSGVLADRYGRKQVFCAGMLGLSVWTIACGFAQSFVQLAIFRALKGIAAAMTVPSSVGIISSYFTARDRTKALSMFGASGAVGFCVGLISGGFLTSSLGWRYMFYFAVILTGSVCTVGWIILPTDRIKGLEKPKLDLLGAGLSTSGLILLSFVISSGGVYGWGKAFIITLLVGSVALLTLFTFVEKKSSNPIMPLSLWKVKNFAALWISGFVMYGGYQTVVYYTTMISQDVERLSASETAIRYLPMGVTGFTCAMVMSRIVEKVNVKLLLLIGMGLCVIAPISAATTNEQDLNFWKHVFPTTVLGVAGVSIVYCTITVVLMASVPNNVKSLCGGMINTAFQIGSGVGLALSSAIVQAVDKSGGSKTHGTTNLKQYETGLWCCVGLAGVGFLSSAFGIENTGRPKEKIAFH